MSGRCGEWCGWGVSGWGPGGAGAPPGQHGRKLAGRKMVILLRACRSSLCPCQCAVLEIVFVTTSLAVLRARLPELMPRDQHRLRRRADQAAALRDDGARERAFGQILAELDAAEARVEARPQAVPVITYPAELPVSQKKDEIA